MPNQHVPGADAHLADDDHNWYPERTMPQGTQENGVINEHEQRDANLPAIIRWFAGLAAGVLVVMGLLWGAFRLMIRREAEPLPSPVFAQQQVPAEPRLIPNPWDSPAGQPLRGPVEYHQDYEQTENQELIKTGLLDEATGLPKLPQDKLGRVMQKLGGTPPGPAPVDGTPHGTETHGTETHGTDTQGDRTHGVQPQADPHGGVPQPAPEDTLIEPYPSDMSGGTRLEDRLR